MEEEEIWNHNDIVRLPQEEFEQFIKFHLLKDYLERENHGLDLVIGSTDLATYMYLDRLNPKALTIGNAHQADMRKITDNFKKGPKLTLVDTRDDKSVFIPEWIHRFKLDVEKVRREEVRSQNPIQMKAPISTDYPIFTDAPGVLNVQFERTEAGFFYKQNHPLSTPHVLKDGIVPFEAMRDYIMPEIISHYPVLTMKYYDTILYVWLYTQTICTMKRRNPNHWKLDSYLQIQPLKHSPCQDKKIFTSLNELLREDDWVRQLLKNGSGEPFDEP
ncbi:hypothetical protein TNCV_2043681 [Trichonephila clavipes]|nr:hypothetical protein TNCV_2043681 [Trichonephila clavipes]